MKKKKNKKSSARSILVIGDLIVDAHHHMDYGGISQETGGALGLHTHTKLSWGGAGLVVQHILALGGSVTFVTLVGDDEYSRDISTFHDKHLRKWFFKDNGRHTIVKERFLIDGKKVLRVNRGSSEFISKKTEDAILAVLKSKIASFDKIIIADYRHGLLTPILAQKIIAFAKKAEVPTYIDSQVTREGGNHAWYKGADVFFLNQKEAMSIDPTFDKSDLISSLTRLKMAADAHSIIVKLGEEGSASLVRETFFETPALKVKAIDPVGAGDAFLGAMAVSASLDKKAIEFANTWAGFSTTIQGTEVSSISDFKKSIQ